VGVRSWAGQGRGDLVRRALRSVPQCPKLQECGFPRSVFLPLAGSAVVVMGCGGSKSVATVQPIEDSNQHGSKTVDALENGIKSRLQEPGDIRSSEESADRVPNGHPLDQPDAASTVLNPIKSDLHRPEPEPLSIKQANGSSSAIAFEIPLAEGESLIQRHPPKRFTRLEDNQLTVEMFRGKHNEAANRRNKILNERVQSARVRNLRSAGRAKSRTTMRSEDDAIEGGVDDHRRDDGTELS